MRPIIALAAPLACLVLGGCFARQVYDGHERPVGQIAILQGSPHARFTGYADASAPGEPAFTRLDGGWSGHPIEIHVLPGKYSLRVLCDWGDTSATAIVETDVEVDMTYPVSCEKVPNTDKARAVVSAGVQTPTPRSY